MFGFERLNLLDFGFCPQIVNNDITAHQENLDLLQDECNRLVAQEKSSPEAGRQRRKMDDLVSEWDRLKDKAAKRQAQLEDAHREVSRGSKVHIWDLVIQPLFMKRMGFCSYS